MVLTILAFFGCAQHGKPVIGGLRGRSANRGSYNIMGVGKSTERMLFRYMRQHNTTIGKQKLKYIIRTYISESAYEGINHDVAFIQMCHETNFLKFGGAVKANQNNFCGLGTLNYDVSGACFFTIKDGIRAHIQHLKAYGSRLPLNNSCIDPRFDLIPRGSAKSVCDLTGKWAVDGRYGEALQQKIDALLGVEDSRLPQ
jgi:hypothetical protein